MFRHSTRFIAAGVLGLGALLAVAIPAKAGPTGQPNPPQFQNGNNGVAGASGSAMQVNSSGGGTAAQLTSVGDGYGVVYVTFPTGTTVSQLQNLSTDYTLTQGICTGASPRLAVDVNDPGQDQALVNFGTQPYGGCANNLPSSMSFISSGTSSDSWQVDGSNSFETWSQFVATYGSDQLADVAIINDSGWAQSGGSSTTGTEQVLIQNWNVNGTIFFASPGGNANCTNETLPPGTYQDINAGPNCTIDGLNHINGNVTVQTGGSLQDGDTANGGAYVHGNIQANHAAWISIAYGAYVGGNIQVQGTTSEPGPSGGSGFGYNLICHVNVGGDVQVQNNGVNAPFQIGDCYGSLVVGGNLQVTNNSGTQVVGGTNGASYPTTVHNDVQVNNNTGTGSVEYNQAGGNCPMNGNHPTYSGDHNSAPAGHTDTCNGVG